MRLLSIPIDSLSREEVARHIFGEQSSRVIHHGTETLNRVGAILSDEPLYQYLVLTCLVLYMVWIYRYAYKRGFKAFVGIASAFTQSQEHGVHTGGSRRRLGDVVLLWSLIVGIYVLFITKILEVVDGIAFNYFFSIIGGTPITEYIASRGIGLWMLVVGVGFFVAMSWSIALLYLIDLVSRRRSLFRPILELRSQMLLYSVIYLMPCILLCSFGAYDSLRFYLALFMVVIFTLGYLIRSFLLFHSKKISILIWILYLCAVEIFPTTLVWVFFTHI